MRPTRSSTQGYLPTLDGWRALSVLGVIFCHDTIHSLGWISDRWLYDHGGIGVDVFFAISGILICSRLLAEEQTHGSIGLRSFYIRRATRILPAAFVYLCAIAALCSSSLIHVGVREWLGSLFFFRNYTSLLGTNTARYYTEHFWSLAVEEHFYMILPCILVLTNKRYRLLAMSVIALLVAARCLVQLHSRPWPQIQFHTDTRLNSLLIPAIFAVLLAQRRERFRSMLELWPIAAIGVLLTLSIPLGEFWQVTLLAFLMPCMVLGTVLNPLSLIGKFLEMDVLRYVGRVSYSLYLWQQLFFVSHFGPAPRGIFQSWPVNLAMTFLCAILSHRYIEQPMIHFGRRLAGRRAMALDAPDAGLLIGDRRPLPVAEG